MKRWYKDQQRHWDVWLLPGFPPSAFLWPGATEQCVCDEHEGASSSSMRQGPPCHWHGTSKPAAVTLHHYHHTSLVRTPRRGRHTRKGANKKKKKKEAAAELIWLVSSCGTREVRCPTDLGPVHRLYAFVSGLPWSYNTAYVREEYVSKQANKKMYF